MKPARAMLLSFSTVCLIWSNAAAAEPAGRDRDRPGTRQESDAGRTPEKSTKETGDRIIVKGRRPGIHPRDLERSARREARKSLLKFRLTLPRLLPLRRPGM